MDIVFFGIQGSGKGTQAKRLAAEFGYEIFEAGGELRKIASSNTPLGATVKGYIDQGHLVPHEIIMEVVATAIAARPRSQKILFDGIPRDDAQMHDFNAIMKREGREFKCIHFLLSKEEAVQRILGRAASEGRADDADVSIIERRMSTFVTKTLPVIKAYQEKNIVIDINAAESVENIYDHLKRVVVTSL